jgi:hypothetical protein
MLAVAIVVSTIIVAFAFRYAPFTTHYRPRHSAATIHSTIGPATSILKGEPNFA